MMMKIKRERGEETDWRYGWKKEEGEMRSQAVVKKNNKKIVCKVQC